MLCAVIKRCDSGMKSRTDDVCARINAIFDIFLFFVFWFYTVPNISLVNEQKNLK